MPSIGFVLPHWLYWAGLLLFPLIAMYLSRQKQPEPGSRSLGIAYFIWVVGGFFGFHRLYLKNKWGLLYWPLFAVILFASSMERAARIEFSDANSSIVAIESSTERTRGVLEKATRELEDATARLAEIGDAPEDQSRRNRLQRTIDRQTERIEGAEAKLAAMAEEKLSLTPAVEQATQNRERWSNIAFSALVLIIAFMLVDAFLMPSMLKKARKYLETNPDGEVDREILADDRQFAGTGWAGVIDRISLFTGEFVALWSVIAVFVYYYEVIVRYVFNSPTNWAHEGMFLMFGMQYLVAGAYAMLSESHVRVDIFYANFSPRGKAITDLLTSVFFFIFAGTLVWTGWIFAMDSVAQGEVSFTEWGIQYWPVKLVIVLGGVLLFLQGVSRVSKDIALVIAPKQEAQNGS